MPRCFWHFDAKGLPLERIDTRTGEHVPVFTGGPEETRELQDGGRPITCAIPKVSGVMWDFGRYGHPRKSGDLLGWMPDEGRRDVYRSRTELVVSLMNQRDHVRFSFRTRRD